MKRLIPIVLVTAGCLIIGLALWLKADASQQQDQLIREYERYLSTLTGQGSTPQQLAEPATYEIPELLPDPDALTEVAENVDLPIEVVGIMSIPKIDLKVAVGEGIDGHTLKYSVGRFPHTARPGQAGNFAVAGHRNYTYGEFFNRLDELEIGDTIEIQSDLEAFTYRVTETFVVEPEDVWVLDPSDDQEITLVTCTPIRIATHRLIVKGLLE